MGTALATGDVLRGKYRLEQVLGRGGMGVVHLATHVVIGQRVAIKVLLTTPEDKEYVTARFLREARAAALLESEHVVRILDVDNLEDGTPFMVMEYLQGEDLAQILRTRGRLPVEEAVRYVLGACEALAEAHARGIVHRDLKPSNLFRAETAAKKEPIVKLLDFGISKLSTPGEDLSLTDTHAVIGSPIYMSPEQLLSSRDVDHRTDIWSLGVTLYKLASGGLPFEASSASALGAQIAATSPRPLKEVLPNPPVALDDVVMKCLARRAADRFADVVELARALGPLVSDPDLVVAVERARDRGQRAGVVKASAEAQAAPPILEASGERWTRSQQSDRPPPPLEASGERWTRSQQSDRPPPISAPPHSPNATRDATPISIAPPPALERGIELSTGTASKAIPVRASSFGAGAIAAIVALVIAIAGGITFVTLRKPAAPPATASPASAEPRPSSASSVTAASATTPSASTTASTASPSATTPPTTARPPPAAGSIRPRPKPKGTWSKDPSELDIK